MEWKEVVEYAFLADFDLLRDTRQDISQRPWATPAGRLAMDTHFKMCRALEELDRLNVEVPRLATYIRDEDTYLRSCEDQLRLSNPPLALQIALHREERGRYNAHHNRRLLDLAKLPGFTGFIIPGESITKEVGESASTPSTRNPIPSPTAVSVDERMSVDEGLHDTDEALEEEELAERSSEEASNILADLFSSVLRLNENV